MRHAREHVRPAAGGEPRRSLVMGDAVFVAMTLLFFLAAAAYVAGCERIR